MIKQAEQAGSRELPPPTDTGGSGSSLTEVTIYNDSPAELRIVISGPESRIEVIPASPTSDEYSLVGPLSCRTDVPTLTITVAAGDYRVLVEDISGGVRPFTGTWNLTSGDRFASCFYLVTTFGCLRGRWALFARPSNTRSGRGHRTIAVTAVGVRTHHL